MTETTTTEVVEVDVREIEELLQRARSQAPLSEADRELICRLSQSYLHLNELVADKNTTILSHLTHLGTGISHCVSQCA